MSPAIQTTGLTKSYGRTPVLTGLDLAVEPGTVFALLGPNGAGKTTLVSILATLVRPDAGHASVCGHDVVTHARQVQQSISLTGQYAAVDEILTGAENLRLMARLAGLGSTEARRRADELLEQFDLVDAARRRTGTYSGGMRRRLDLAISLVTAPPVIFLDEPTTGLDTRSRQGLWDAIDGLTDRGTTILLTTQYLEEADVLADRIAVLDGGVVAAEGTPAELKRRVGGTVVELRDRHDRVVAEHPTDGTADGVRTVINSLDLAAVGRAHPGVTIALRRPTLDDAFLALTSATSVPSKEKAA